MQRALAVFIRRATCSVTATAAGRLIAATAAARMIVATAAARLVVALVASAMVSAAFAGAGPPAPPPPPAQDYPPDPNDPDPPKPKAPAVELPPGDPAQVAKGAQLFKDFCQKCHGIGMASPGPPFFDLRAFPHDEKPRFVESVTNGKRAMPAWGPVIKPGDIESLWAYVSSYKSK